MKRINLFIVVCFSFISYIKPDKTFSTEQTSLPSNQSLLEESTFLDFYETLEPQKDQFLDLMIGFLMGNDLVYNGLVKILNTSLETSNFCFNLHLSYLKIQFL